MAPQSLGRLVTAHILPQAVAGVAAAGNMQAFHYYTATPRRDDPLVDDPLLGADLDNPLDTQPPASGLIEASCNITAPLCLNAIGLFLPLLFDAAAPTGAGPYTHGFTSGQRETAGASLAFTEHAKWRRPHTWTPESLSLGFAQESGRRILTLNGMASDVDDLDADPTGVALAPHTPAFVPARGGAVVRYDGTVIANLVGGTFNYRRPLEAFRPAARSDGTAQEFTPQQGASAGIEGAALRVTDNVFYDIARSKAAAPVSIEYALGASTLTFAMPAVRITPTERPVSGPGLRTETYNLRAEVTTGAPMVATTLVNEIDSYPVAA